MRLDDAVLAASPRILFLEPVRSPVTPPDVVTPAPAAADTMWVRRHRRGLAVFGGAAVVAAILLYVFLRPPSNPPGGPGGLIQPHDSAEKKSLKGGPYKAGTATFNPERPTDGYKQDAQGAYLIDSPSVDFTFTCEKGGFATFVIFRPGKSAKTLPSDLERVDPKTSFRLPGVIAPGPGERAALFAVVTPVPPATWISAVGEPGVTADQFEVWVGNQLKRQKPPAAWAEVLRIDLVGVQPETKD